MIQRMTQRYILRVLGIPTTYTREMLENEFDEHNLKYKHIHFATKNNHTSVGFIFIDFESEKDKKTFLEYYECNKRYIVE